MRTARAKDIMTDFQDRVPDVMPDVITGHQDSKLLPGFYVRSPKEERLLVLISFEEKELLLAVPKLDSSPGKAQAKAVYNALHDNLDDQLQIMCCEWSLHTVRTKA